MFKHSCCRATTYHWFADGNSLLNRRLGEADGRRSTLLILSLIVAIRSNECVGEDIVPHGEPQCGSIDRGCPKVNTSKHARVPYLFERGREAVECPRDSCHCVGRHGNRSLLAEGLRQYATGSRAYTGVRRRILRKWRGRDQRSPSRVGSRSVVTVGVPELDRSNPPPETVGILRVPTTDSRSAVPRLTRASKRAVRDIENWCCAASEITTGSK